MNIKFSEKRVIDTDVALWCVYNPEDLAHRFEDPIDWFSYDFAISKEFAAGKLIAIGTGADSGFLVRFTNEGLTEREQKCVIKSQIFRLRVNHGWFCIDGDLPRDYSIDRASSSKIISLEDYSYDQVYVPNGDYRVTVYALDFSKEVDDIEKEDYVTENKSFLTVPISRVTEDLDKVEYSSDELFDENELFDKLFDENELTEDVDIADDQLPYEQSFDENELPSYVAVFEVIEDLNTVEYPFDIPELTRWQFDKITVASCSDTDIELLRAEERLKLALKLEYIGCPLIFRSDGFFPGIKQEFFLTPDEDKCLGQLYWQNNIVDDPRCLVCIGLYGEDDLPFVVVIANKIQPGAIATVFDVENYLCSKLKGRFNGQSSTLVKIKNIYELTPGIDSLCWAVFEPYEPLPSTANPVLVEELKQWFAGYAATDLDYQQKIRYHRFYVERVEALTDPLDIGYAIAHALNLPSQTKYNLLVATESELIEQLNEIIKTL